MQLTIDLTNQPAAYGKRVIAMIEAFYGLPRTETVTLSQMKEIADARVNAEDDADLLGIGFTVDGARVDPSRVVMFSPSAPAKFQCDKAATEPSAPLVPAVPPVPTAAAPTAPAAPTSPAGVVLDTDGLPWDARIHAGSKEKNKDGRWRAKKGLNDGALVRRVQDELRAVMAVPAGSAVAPAPFTAPTGPESVPSPMPPTPPVAEHGANPFATTPPAMPPMPQVPAVVTPFVPPPPPVATTVLPIMPQATPGVSTAAVLGADPTTMPELMPRVTGAMAEGKIPPTAMLDACKAVGLPDLPSLAHRPDLIPQVWATLKASHPGVWV